MLWSAVAGEILTSSEGYFDILRTQLQKFPMMAEMAGGCDQLKLKLPVAVCCHAAITIVLHCV